MEAPATNTAHRWTRHLGTAVLWFLVVLIIAMIVAIVVLDQQIRHIPLPPPNPISSP